MTVSQVREGLVTIHETLGHQPMAEGVPKRVSRHVRDILHQISLQFGMTEARLKNCRLSNGF